jgi:hypothetical protein
MQSVLNGLLCKARPDIYFLNGNLLYRTWSENLIKERMPI